MSPLVNIQDVVDVARNPALVGDLSQWGPTGIVGLAADSSDTHCVVLYAQSPDPDELDCPDFDSPVMLVATLFTTNDWEPVSSSATPEEGPIEHILDRSLARPDVEILGTLGHGAGNVSGLLAACGRRVAYLQRGDRLVTVSRTGYCAVLSHYTVEHPQPIAIPLDAQKRPV